MAEEGRPTNATVGITCVSLLLQIIGLVTPGWLQMVVGYDVKVNFGLWYMVTCIRSVCTATSTIGGTIGNDAQSRFNAVMSSYRGLTVAGAIIGLVALILLIVSRRASQPIPAGRYVATFFMLVSGFLSLYAVIKFYNTYNHPYGFPYSLLITGTGGILAIILDLALMCKLLWSSRRSEEESVITQPGMAMNPPQNAVGEV